MRLVLDAGGLIAIDRSDRRAAAVIALGRRAGADLVTVAPVVGQAWRDGARQANLARALPMIEVLAVDLGAAQSAGEILRDTGGWDVVDALLALAARPGDQILTSDPTDIQTLLESRRVQATVVQVSSHPSPATGGRVAASTRQRTDWADGTGPNGVHGHGSSSN